MITLEEFKELFAMIPGEPEFEITFADSDDDYMIIKYKDHVTFQRCGYDDGTGEIIYGSLEALCKDDMIDSICLERDWEKIDCIVVDATWNLLLPEDVMEIKTRYGSHLS